MVVPIAACRIIGKRLFGFGAGGKQKRELPDMVHRFKSRFDFGRILGLAYPIHRGKQ